MAKRISTFLENEADIMSVRMTVFVEEQGVPAEIERDEYDATCLHIVIYDVESPVGTGRLDLVQGKVGRVAVLASHRRRGIGRQIMAEIEDLARKRGLSRLWFHAQREAIAFYEALGYESQGDEFMEAGIPHIKMHKVL